MKKKSLRTIRWKDGCAVIIDQTALPGTLRYCRIRTVEEMWKAIKTLKIRGAPALGAAAGYGVYLGIRNSTAKDFAAFHRQLQGCVRFLGSSRPTAHNLFWGLQRMLETALVNKYSPVERIKDVLLKEADRIVEEDRIACRSIGACGVTLVPRDAAILTICNTGILATIDYGTALGVVYAAQAKGKRPSVFACETRPLLQGARLTAWELRRAGIPATLICEGMAAAVLQQKNIALAIAGADRIAANGDTANKVGTHSLAVLCRHFGVPFYIAAPASTFDLSLSSGSQIPIEERAPDEVTRLWYKTRMAPPGVGVFNPAFDVTAHELISAFITDRGLIRPPFDKNIAATLARS